MRTQCFWLAAIEVLALGHTARAQVLYQENFDIDPSASWQDNGSAFANSADFFFDYSTVGVPPAPGGPRELRLASPPRLRVRRITQMGRPFRVPGVRWRDRDSLGKPSRINLLKSSRLQATQGARAGYQ